MDKKIGKVQKIASSRSDIDTQISEMIEKIVFLESRLGAVEGVMQKTQESIKKVKNMEESMQKSIQKVREKTKVQPVILE